MGNGEYVPERQHTIDQKYENARNIKGFRREDLICCETKAS